MGALSPPSQPITTVPADGLNLMVVRQGEGLLEVTPTTPMHQWFAGTFTNIPTDREVTLRVLMAGKDVGGFRVQLWKWVGLRPLYTYADYTAYTSYEWFRRDARGQWWSGDPWKHGEERHAGNGPTPEQQAIPAHLAPQFLSADGAFWWPWREIEDTESLEKEQIFTMRQRFDQPTVTIALHPPFTYSYLQTTLARVERARPAGVFIDTLGKTRGGRDLQVLRIDDPACPTPLTIDRGQEPAYHPSIDDRLGKTGQRVILITAREHATEHTGSWVLMGILRRLLANTPAAARLRQRTTWLLAPLYDPDGSADAVFNVLANRFFEHKDHSVYGDDTPPEVIAYARYLRAFINSGRPLVATATFYGLECNEAKPVCAPSAVSTDLELNVSFNRRWMRRLRQLGIMTGDAQPWGTGWVPHRLHGWCSYYYGALALPFEINDRYPEQRLTCAELDAIGGSFPATLVDFLESGTGKQRQRQTREFLRERERNMELWYRTSIAGTKSAPTLHDLLNLGY